MKDKMLRRDNFIEYARAQFGSEPEYLWENSPADAVLRHADNQKWYAVLMTVDGARLGLPGGSPVEIAVLKCDPLLVGTLRGREGFLPAYHMNKEHWITLRLDGTAEQEEGFRLLELSFELTRAKMKKAPKRATENGGISS